MEDVKVLIVEDDYEAAKHLENLLNDIGYHVPKTISRGEDAIDFVKQNPVDIILMDIELAGELDGVQTIKAINKITNTLFIYITGLKDKKTFYRAKATFPDFFLSKPFNKYQLIDVIEGIIEDEDNFLKSFNNDYFFVKNNLGVYKKYAVDLISHLEAKGSYTEIHLKDSNKITLSKNLKRTLCLLKAKHIQKINRSYAININEIESIDQWSIKLFNKKESLLVQDKYRDTFKKLIKKL